MKTFATALLVLGASATRVRSLLKQVDYESEYGLPECNEYCAEGYFYTKDFYDCSSKEDMWSDYYAPTPQCPVYCEATGVCPEPVVDTSHEDAQAIMD